MSAPIGVNSCVSKKSTIFGPRPRNGYKYGCLLH